MGGQPCPMGIIKTDLHRSSSAPHLLRNLYLHLHQACLRGRHLLRLDMAVPKAFCLRGSTLLSNKTSPNRVPCHLQDLDLHRDLDPPLAKALRPVCLLDFNSQDLEGLDSRECSEEHRSSEIMRK